jgi:putative N-acetyltransferase (TIGR04045 family)
MLETTSVWGEKVPAYLSRTVASHVASEAWQIAAYYRLRATIFADEQGLFAGSDIDEHDASATPIVAVDQVAGMADDVIGTVRIYPTDAGTWFGGRLGVTPKYRSQRAVGTSLICAAVSTAHAWGCRRFLATIQAQNVRYFEQHHFAPLDSVDVCGQPHRLMQADLAAYPPQVARVETPVFGHAAAALVRRVRAA